MQPYTVEILRRDEDPVLVAASHLHDPRAAWRYLEGLAHQMSEDIDARIRVRNSAGEIIIFTGVMTLLASIERRP